MDNKNVFNIPNGGYELRVGELTTLSWQPNSDGTVTIVLLLRKDTTGVHSSEITLASSIPNSGTFTFTFATDLPVASKYLILLQDDTDVSNYVWTPISIATSTSSIESSTTSSIESSTTSSIKSSTTSATESASRTTIRTSPSSSSSENENVNELSSDAKIAIGLCVPIAVVVIAALILFLWRRRKHSKENSEHRPSPAVSPIVDRPFTGKPELEGSRVETYIEKPELDACNERVPGVVEQPKSQANEDAHNAPISTASTDRQELENTERLFSVNPALITRTNDDLELSALAEDKATQPSPNEPLQAFSPYPWLWADP